MNVLALDASTYVGTVAVWQQGRLVSEETARMRGAEQERLMPAIAAALEHAHIGPRDLDRIVCGAGPGSFTSLRIAGSLAKGIATAGEAELWSVPSLGLIVTGTPSPRGPGRYLAALDALRGELYVACYEIGAHGVSEILPPRRIAESELERAAAMTESIVVGPGRTAHSEPHARGADALTSLHERVSLDAWEPAYGRLAEAQVKWEAKHGRPLPER